MDNQKTPYEINDVIHNLINTNANLTLENAELKAIIKKLQEGKEEEA